MKHCDNERNNVMVEPQANELLKTQKSKVNHDKNNNRFIHIAYYVFFL